MELKNEYDYESDSESETERRHSHTADREMRMRAAVTHCHWQCRSASRRVILTLTAARHCSRRRRTHIVIESSMIEYSILSNNADINNYLKVSTLIVVLFFDKLMECKLYEEHCLCKCSTHPVRQL